MIRTLLTYNMIVGAIRLGRKVKLDHMDVLSASDAEIVAGDERTGEVFIRLSKQDIGSELPQVDHFRRRIFTGDGVEIRSPSGGAA